MPQTLVVGLDLSEASITALHYALSLTRGIETEVHVIRCIEEEKDSAVEEPPRQLERINAAREQVDQIVRVGCPPSATVSTHIIFSVSPAAEICQLGDKVNADLVVVGAGGDGGANCSFAVGSCAEGVLRGAGRSVLVVRTPTSPVAA